MLTLGLLLLGYTTGETWHLKDTPINMIEDKTNGVVCYWIPRERFMGNDGPASLALSCVKVR